MSGLKTISTALLLFILAAAAFSGSVNKPTNYNPWIDAHGGPDAYGYTWIDSDEPGGPVYQWIDITTIGTQVTGLTDDNFVGPFPVGFDYDYYWYTVDEFYIGSNGYLKIPPSYNICQTFPASIPLTAVPNDFIGVYIADLDYSWGGLCYYWTNETDTCIVSFINVPAWQQSGSTGRHTFQVILDGAENTILINYGVQVGAFSNNDILIGIENNNGQVGLEHSHDVAVPHNDYSVKFTRPDSTTYQVHDFAVYDVLSEGSKAIFKELNQAFSPEIWIKNVGNQPEAGAQMMCNITNPSGQTVYSDAAAVSALSPGQVELITLMPWTPGYIGQYSVSVTVQLTGDMNPANDNKIAEVDIVDLPGELAYDDGSAETGLAWNGEDGGYAMYFESPGVPAEITSMRIYINSSGVAPLNVFIAEIIDDDAPNNHPGTVLFSDTIECPVTSAAWYTTEPNITVDDGKFFGVWKQTAYQSTYMGIDQTAPISRQTWEFTQGWAPYREAESDEAMIRVMVGEGQIPEPVIEASPDSLFFGEVTIGDTNSIPFTLYNVGLAGDLIITEMTFTGVPGTILLNVTGFTPDTLAPGDSMNLTAHYHPLLPLPNVGSINFANNSTVSPYMVYFSGSGVGVGVNDPANQIPDKYELSQNYPNPFNSGTLFSFALPTAGFVNLTLYDLQGREAAVICSGEFSAGRHQVSFKAEDLASGVYLACFTAGDYRQARKVLYIK